MTSPIEIRNLSRRFGQVLAVDDVTFSAESGRVTGFLGPNGSGKSTTLRMLLGLIRPSGGSATFGECGYADLAHPSSHVGVVIDDAGFHPGRTARNHLRVLATAGGHPQTRVDDVLERVDLARAADRRVKGYSTGMRQRLAIAAALLGDPDVLILDEPTNGLDPPGIRWVRDLIREHADGGGTVLISSHVLSEVAQFADDVVILANGQLRAIGPIDEVLAGSHDPVTRVRSTDTARLSAALRENSVAFEATSDGALLTSAGPERIGEIACRHGIVLVELVSEVPSLEEAFLELTGARA
jgi:ABC-2 type transport system ATP-binding protein